MPLFTAYRKWLTEQFEALGFSHADEEEMSLLSRVQGVAMVTHAFKEKDFLRREMEKIEREIENLVCTKE